MSTSVRTRLSRRSDASRFPGSRLLAARLTAYAGGVTAAIASGELAALKAAGLISTKPDGGNAIAGIINTLQANWTWLIITGVGLALAIVAGLVIFGSQRAPEHVFRIIGGIVLLVVVIPAVLH